MFARRCLTLACATATAAVAVAPGTALAMPPDRPPVREIPMKARIPSAPVPAAAQPSAAPIVREVRTDGDSTLTLVISGSALLIAAGTVALSGHDHRRLSRPA